MASLAGPYGPVPREDNGAGGVVSEPGGSHAPVKAAPAGGLGSLQPEPIHASTPDAEKMAQLLPTPASMSSQWQNFLCNLGEWRGSFASLDHAGAIRESTPSILSLEAHEEGRLVRFRLRRFGPEGESSTPIREMQEDYRSLGRQVMFFANGSFGKGTLQVAPGTAFGGEFGFVGDNRRHRLVQLHQTDGAFEQLVLIREFRSGSAAEERPPLELGQLEGRWQGTVAGISADWPEPDHEACQMEVALVGGEHLEISTSFGQTSERWGGVIEGRQVRSLPVEGGGAEERLLLLPDGGYHLSPLKVSHRRAFRVEAGWLQGDDHLQRLIRQVDSSGAWQRTLWINLRRV